jgi:hypothetical protein
MVKRGAKRSNFPKNMIKGLLLAVVVGISGFFAWGHFSNSQVRTPEQEIERFVAKGTVSAVDLAEIVDKYPDLVFKALRDRRITVTGVLQKAVVKGVGSHDLILDLEGSRKRKITFTSDVNSYARANSHLGGSKQKFQKLGRDIVVYESAPKTAKAPGGGALQKMLGGIQPPPPQPEPDSEAPSHEAKHNSGPTERVVFRELDTVTLEGIFQHITNSAIFIEWRTSKSL